MCVFCALLLGLVRGANSKLLFAGHDTDPRVGSRSVQNVTGRVGVSGREVFKSHGLGRVRSRGYDEMLTGPVRSWPASCFLLTRGSDPRIPLADPTLEPLLPALLPKGFPRTNNQ